MARHCSQPRLYGSRAKSAGADDFICVDLLQGDRFMKFFDSLTQSDDLEKLQQEKRFFEGGGA